MKKHRWFLLIAFILSALFLGACNFPVGESDADADATTIASTSAAVFTRAAETSAVTTGVPSATTEPGATVLPTGTNTLIPTVPPASTATKKPIPCNRGSFVKDVTIPDGKEIPAGDAFTKTWRIKNNGSCTWGANYVVIFDSGEQMGAPATAPLGGSVAPGATIDISVNLTAPSNPGNYQGNFKLRSHDNIVFGINADAQGPFWVKIVVPNPTPTPELPTLPPPPPPIHSSGSLDISSSFTVDLDEGQIAPPIANRDIQFKAVSAVEKYITVSSNVVIVDMGVSKPTKAQCDGITIGLAQTPLSSSLVNHYFCYNTNLGRTGRFKITAYDGSTLSIDYLTWE